jgi:hypothetical protein
VLERRDAPPLDAARGTVLALDRAPEGSTSLRWGRDVTGLVVRRLDP